MGYQFSDFVWHSVLLKRDKSLYTHRDHVERWKPFRSTQPGSSSSVFQCQIHNQPRQRTHQPLVKDCSWLSTSTHRIDGFFPGNIKQYNECPFSDLELSRNRLTKNFLCASNNQLDGSWLFIAKILFTEAGTFWIISWQLFVSIRTPSISGIRKIAGS